MSIHMMTTVDSDCQRRRRGSISSRRQRQSFDRFGDDLAELLLLSKSSTYLTLEDRLRLRRVSKQWHRVILQTVTVLTINKKLVKNKTFQAFCRLLQLCPNISVIDFKYKIDDWILTAITRNCHHLRRVLFNRFSVKVTDATIDAFFGRFAKQLLTIQRYSSSSNGRQLERGLNRHIIDCTQLSAFDYRNSGLSNVQMITDYQYFITDKPVFSKLQKMSFYIRNDKMITIYQQFVAVYGKQLTAFQLKIEFSFILPIVMDILSGLTQLRQLTDLSIDVESDNRLVVNVLAEQLRQIGLKCGHQLRRLSISGNMKHTFVGYFDLLTAMQIANYRRLKRFEFVFIGIWLTSLQPLFSLQQSLTHLRVSRSIADSLSAKIIPKIASNLPCLQYLEITIHTIDDLILLKSLTQLANIQTVILNIIYPNPEFPDDYIVIINEFRKIRQLFVTKVNIKMV